MRWDIKSARDKWRKSFAKLMELPPEMVDDWTLDHLMGEINGSRNLILKRSCKP